MESGEYVSISGDFHLNSRPTHRARMSGRLASPLFVKIHLVETNSLPLASDSPTFSYLLWIQQCSRQRTFQPDGLATFAGRVLSFLARTH